jgi:hypothetical protein
VPQRQPESRVSGLSRRFADQSGLASLIAIGAIAVIGIFGASAVAYSSDNARQASYSKASLSALALAEAGLNNAFAVIGNPDNDPMDTTLLEAAQSQAYEGGTATWWGTLDASSRVWTVFAQGEVRNPTGASRPVRRTLTAKVPVAAGTSVTQPISNNAWNYVLATRTGNPCDMTLAGDVSVNSRLYVLGNLCLSSGARVAGGELSVRGSANLTARTSAIGAASLLVAEVHVGAGCKYQNHPIHTPCSVVDNVFALVSDQTLPAVTPPAADWDGWYGAAAPGPRNACSSSSGSPPAFDNNSVRDNSLGTASLTPSTSYTCIVGPAEDPRGELSWNASTRLLTVRGTVFVDGSLTVDSSLAQYDGHGTIYVSGGFVLSAGARLCATVAGSDCNLAPGGWNPDSELLAIAANGSGNGGAFPGNSIQFGSHSRFQGAAYATNAIQFGGYSAMQGPMIASTIVSCASQQFPPFARLTLVPSGLPGNPPPAGRPGRPYEFTN